MAASTLANRKDNLALCELGVAQILHLKHSDIANAMQKLGVKDRLTVKHAQTWRASPESAPDFIKQLIHERSAASQAARKQAASKKYLSRLTAARPLVAELIANRDPLLNDKTWLRANPHMEEALGEQILRAGVNAGVASGTHPRNVDWSTVDPIDVFLLNLSGWIGVPAIDARKQATRDVT